MLLKLSRQITQNQARTELELKTLYCTSAIKCFRSTRLQSVQIKTFLDINKRN